MPSKIKKQVLADHKRIGPRFIPPMVYHLNWTEVRYINDILPEIIWMGLINEKFGYKQGIELSADFAKTTFEIMAGEKLINFAICSNFNLLSATQKSELLKKIRKQGNLHLLRDALAPMLKLYSDFPLSFVGKSRNPGKKKEMVGMMKNSIGKHFNKYLTPSLIAQAGIAYIRGITGGLAFSADVRMPNLEALILAPESDDANHAAGFVRTLAMNEVMTRLNENDNGNKEKLFEWPMSFWNRNYYLSKCEF